MSTRTTTRAFFDPRTWTVTYLVWDRAIARGRVYGIVLDGLWMHVGTPDALAKAEERVAHAHRT